MSKTVKEKLNDLVVNSPLAQIFTKKQYAKKIAAEQAEEEAKKKRLAEEEKAKNEELAKSALETLVQKYLSMYEKELEKANRIKEYQSALKDNADNKEKDTKSEMGYYTYYGLPDTLTDEKYNLLDSEYKPYYSIMEMIDPKQIASPNTGYGNQHLENNANVTDKAKAKYKLTNVPKNFVKIKMREELIAELEKKISILKPINDNDKMIESYNAHIVKILKSNTFYGNGENSGYVDEQINKTISDHVKYLFNKQEDSELVKQLLLPGYPGVQKDYFEYTPPPPVSYARHYEGGTRTPNLRSKKHKIQKRPTKRRRHQIKRSRRNKK